MTTEQILAMLGQADPGQRICDAARASPEGAQALFGAIDVQPAAIYGAVFGRWWGDHLRIFSPPMQAEMARYVLTGLVYDEFTLALVSNDFVAIARSADDENRDKLLDWASFMHNAMPSDSFGSHETCARWAGSGGAFCLGARLEAT